MHGGICACESPFDLSARAAGPLAMSLSRERICAVTGRHPLRQVRLPKSSSHSPNMTHDDPPPSASRYAHAWHMISGHVATGTPSTIPTPLSLLFFPRFSRRCLASSIGSPTIAIAVAPSRTSARWLRFLHRNVHRGCRYRVQHHSRPSLRDFFTFHGIDLSLRRTISSVEFLAFVQS